MKWAEVRELIHGVTAAVGSSGGSCIDLLIRNLDEDQDSHFLAGFDMVYNSSNVTDILDESDAEDYTAELATGSLDSVLHHVAEGKNGSVRDEIDYMLELGMVGPGEVYVHATDASTEQLAEMAATGTGIIWSPRSNLALYGTTTPITIAEALGVPWAIGTDWTPSGSMAELQELACADTWLADKGSPVPREALWEKGTSDAARILGLDGVMGSLAVGYQADIAVFAYGSDIYNALFSAGSEDVKLVVVAGKTLYGRAEWVDMLAEEPGWCETLDVCGESQKVCVKAADSGEDSETLAEIEADLVAALAGTGTMPAGYEYAAELYGLFECSAPPECSLAEPGSGDEDGDGVQDSGDNCPGVYNPDQWDEEGDGLGDECDDCPLTSESTCEPAAADMDSDGVENDLDNCPSDANSDQSDRDGDGIGDVCDACPDQASSDGFCDFTVEILADESHAEHPADGTGVHLSNLVVTGVRFEHGFFVQEPGSAEFGGIYVYDQGANTVEAGDVVDITGTYEEYYGLAEITSPSAIVTGSAALPDAIEASACDVATGGSRAESLESMLVMVGAVTVTDENPDDNPDGSGSPNYLEFEVESCLRVDDAIAGWTAQPSLGISYSNLTGILNFTYDNFKLTPRNDEDMTQE
jgi:hypothetical protein